MKCLFIVHLELVYFLFEEDSSLFSVSVIRKEQCACYIYLYVPEAVQMVWLVIRGCTDRWFCISVLYCKYDTHLTVKIFAFRIV